ncbi:hypothetical protein FTW19_17800 [Terriglobus albidus]|uniref:Cupin domain-containing protein n=1 Tax=Terriglobus albidus TaxID=1592106 RepID=A0A5B9EHX2_9BACT|nr:hypothetical protein [Terriglobus albidus]QEE29676.1 hypothetical protein FTW19_17800 [Terriglobus albidus]
MIQSERLKVHDLVIGIDCNSHNLVESRKIPFVQAALGCILFLAAAIPIHAQTRLVSCNPVSERTGEAGCWIILTQPLGELPDGPTYWSLDVFPDRAAAEAAKGSRGSVVEALGKVWLFTIGGKSDQSSGGKRVSQIGPLSIKNGEKYTAQFMEAILPPGAVARTHRHSGPEAFYTEAGESCLETPEGKTVGKNGIDLIVPEAQHRPSTLTASAIAFRVPLEVVS